jgi:hypothetical protein
MTGIKLTPLLLDNERLRQVMRERELLEQPSLNAPAILNALVKTGMHETLAGLTREFPADAPKPSLQLDWPPLLRCLHQELCSGTLLRPITKIMGRKTLLPDPFVIQGGLWQSDKPLSAIADHHSETGLFTSLRLDVVLNGSGQRSVDFCPSETIQAGDAVIAAATSDITYQTSEPFYIWTAFYYSPFACCCQHDS